MGEIENKKAVVPKEEIKKKKITAEKETEDIEKEGR